jgi:hypothetical protein
MPSHAGSRPSVVTIARQSLYREWSLAHIFCVRAPLKPIYFGFNKNTRQLPKRTKQGPEHLRAAETAARVKQTNSTLGARTADAPPVPLGMHPHMVLALYQSKQHTT